MGFVAELEVMFLSNDLGFRVAHFAQMTRDDTIILTYVWCGACLIQ